MLWQNLSRIATALGLIHAQGLIHGRVDSFAIFTEGAASPDFRLGAFEWSLGVGDVQPLDPSMFAVRARVERLIYSYADDWKALGSLFADLLGLDPAKLREDDPFRPGARVIDLSDSEIDFLRRIISPAREDALDARTIERNAERLERELSRHVATRNARLVLLARLNEKMGSVIEEVTDGEVTVDDENGQLSFLEGDLASGAKLVISEQPGGQPDELFVITENLSYRLRPFEPDDGTRSWQAGVLVSLAGRADARLPSERDVYAIPHPIEFVRNKGDANRALMRLRGQAVEWTLMIAPSEGTPEDADTRCLRQGLLLLQVVEALLKALDILPVRVVAKRRDGARTIVRLAPSDGTTRDAIAAEVGERSVAEALDRLFERDDTGVDLEWRLSTSGSLASRQWGDLSARFIEVTHGDRGEPLYEFEIVDVLPDEMELFLRRKGDVGTEALIKRRLRTTKTLESQRDLVSFFIDPRRRLRTSNESLERDGAYADLDDPKKAALEAIWTLLPNHFTVGPPGVGKTRLSSEIVRRRLATEPSSRMLISAQSHQALDHLLGAVRNTTLRHNPDAIVVRSRGSDEAMSTDADVSKTAIGYIDRILASRLKAEVPGYFEKTLLALKSAVQRSQETDEPIKGRDAAGLRALKALVLESANVVFSTSNSQDIERLIEDGAQFDWVLIEESAKASGPELVAPLSLSGRRLLIGDHHQLPPYDAERLRAVLSNKTAIRNALQDADAAIGATFFESGLDELVVALDDATTLDRVSAMALRVLEPFRSLVEEDGQRRPVGGGQRRSVTSELLQQHRMDPAIAELVSQCFYHGRLETGDERKRQAAAPLPFAFGKELPASPIVFIDMPYVSRTGRATPVESGRPRWHNPAEAELVGRLLRTLEVTGAPERALSVAVLSPYRAQVDRLASRIDALRSQRPDSLAGFRGFTHDGRFCGTVDSAQGSEADLVIVSLVRNNQRTGAAALGFLRDRRRMNVLLSRARQQLVLVGCLEFLRESARYAPVGGDDLSFVKTFLATLEALSKESAVRSNVAKATIIRADTLFAGGAA